MNETNFNNNDLKVYEPYLENNQVLDQHTPKKLIKKAQLGDENAREKVVLSNMRFVLSIVQGYKRAGLDADELLSEGNMGLITAINKYDANKEVSFISYAAWWILHFILRAIHTTKNLVRLPMNKIRILQQIFKEQCNMYAEGVQSEKVLEEISTRMDLSPEQIELLIHKSQSTISLDQTANEDNFTSFLEMLEDTNVDSIDSQVESHDQINLIYKCLKMIPKRESEIIVHRYGLDGGLHQSLNELSKKYQITKERVRQLEKKGIQRLQQLLKSKSYCKTAAVIAA